MTPEAEDWLAFQVATTYGLDKATMSERLDWVKENITYHQPGLRLIQLAIFRSGKQQMSHGSFWLHVMSITIVSLLAIVSLLGSQ